MRHPVNPNLLQYRHTQRLTLAVDRERQRLELLINATPSGEVRNHLTEANIHLMEAVQALHKATS